MIYKTIFYSLFSLSSKGALQYTPTRKNPPMAYLLCFLGLFLLSSTSLTAQSAAKIKRQADQLFEAKNYEKSLEEYYKIQEKYGEDGLVNYNMGIAFFETYAYTKSINFLQKHLKFSKKAEPLANYYLARAYHLQDSFLTAAQYYKQHLRTLEEDAPQRPIFKRLILQCLHGPKIQQINSKAIVTGLGNTINSPADDYRVCLNPLLPNSIFFSSKRPLHQQKTETNIYIANQEQGTFLQALPLQARYNTPLSETLLAFFDNGYQLLLLKELSDGSSRVFKDNFDEDSVEVLLPFSNELASTTWDSEHFFVHDSAVIFASTRPGGFGGSDLYYAVREGGIWQTPVNLGSAINSSEDETGPFLATDGLHLFFNSNRAAGMGGHDIYKSFFNKQTQQFSPAENMGIPINSSGDDKDFILQDDLQRGYLTSNRVGGQGGLDLYAVYFRTALMINASHAYSFIEVLEQPPLIVSADPNVAPISNNNPTDRPAATGAAENYSLAPIYYEANTGQIKGSRNTLLHLEKLLKKYPQLQVILSAHSNQEGDASTDLYLTVKQAEVVAQQLIAKGIQPQQLLLRGCSQNYPLASPKNFDGSENPLAKTINQRINITLYHQEQLPANVKVDRIEPNINAVMQSQKAARYQEKLKGLSYKVKLTQSPSIFQHPVLGQHPDITTEKQPQDNAVTYLVGLENTFVDIKYTYNKLLEKGFDKVEIVAYIDGWPITEAEAQVLFTTYPDLSAFLEYRATAN